MLDVFSLCAIVEQSVCPASSITVLPPIACIPMHRAEHALLVLGSYRVL